MREREKSEENDGKLCGRVVDLRVVVRLGRDFRDRKFTCGFGD